MNLMSDEQSLGFMETEILNPNTNNNNTSYLTFGKGKHDNFNNYNDSDEDEPSFMDKVNTESGSKGRKGNSSQWQRMKWSDSRVRLLIHVVASVGDDDATLDGNSGKKFGSGCLQKKGKWKMVSKMMVSKGCQVSPQQCEDKFNDLNKRYKRLNDILGRGISCRVVENPSLLDSMSRLSPKMKEDVKKILSSKHLFYPEMCAYHNGQRIPNCAEVDFSQGRESGVVGQSSKENPIVGHCSDEVQGNDDSDDHDDDLDDDDDDDNDDDLENSYGGHVNSGFRDEMNEFFEDPNNSKVEKREWVKKRLLQLQEQRIGIETEALEMEKKQFKWQRFCDRKDRELEVSRLENERLLLENERMALQLKRSGQVIDSE
ncbi:uncharacterized protein [Rutidosis leptorrhynchoides]|uniref:uncharacterized protein n=1 Tax=Rutidosis leptorrhynchoides TaxID=125765 RepID=UPI003A9A2935